MSKSTGSAELRTMPVLAVRGIVVFPGMILQFDIGRKKSVLAVKAALDAGREIFIVTQTDLSENEPTAEDLYKIGVIAKINRSCTPQTRVSSCMSRASPARRSCPVVAGGAVSDGHQSCPCQEPNFRTSYKTEALSRIAQENSRSTSAGSAMCRRISCSV